MNKRGFTLIELLAVMGIIGVLAVILVPALGRTREQARRIQCDNNLRQHGIAWHIYLDDHDDRFPKEAQVPSDVQCGIYSFGGKVGNRAPYSAYTADMRPLNRYLDVTDASADIFHCPADRKIAPGFSDTIFNSYGNSYFFNVRILEFGGPSARRPLRTITRSYSKVFLEMCNGAMLPGHGGKGWAGFPNISVMVLFADGHVKGPYLWSSEFDSTATGENPERPVYYYP